MMENGSPNPGIKLYDMPKPIEPPDKKVQADLKFEPVSMDQSHEKNIFIIHSTISALMKIKEKLFERRKISSTISKTDFEFMVNETKNHINDFDVSKKLDEIFEEYLPAKNNEMPNANSMWKENEPNMISALEQTTDDAINDQMKSSEPQDEGYADGEAKGTAKVKTDGHFKSGNGALDSSIGA